MWECRHYRPSCTRHIGSVRADVKRAWGFQAAILVSGTDPQRPRTGSIYRRRREDQHVLAGHVFSDRIGCVGEILLRAEPGVATRAIGKSRDIRSARVVSDFSLFLQLIVASAQRS